MELLTVLYIGMTSPLTWGIISLGVITVLIETNFRAKGQVLPDFQKTEKG